MYTILVTSDNKLVVSGRERIMQRSKLVDSLHFLVDPTYNDLDMSEYKVVMEYKLPVSKKYVTEQLTKSDELYPTSSGIDMLEYLLPIDTNLTSEAGNIDIQLTFTHVEMDVNGNVNQRVRKTSTTQITIIPIAAWSDMIPDEALTALDRGMLQLESMINQVTDTAILYQDNQVDDLVLEGNTLKVSANGKVKGSGVSVLSPTTTDTLDGLPDGLLELDNIAEGTIGEKNCNCNCNCGCDNDDDNIDLIDLDEITDNTENVDEEL